jgi:predicted ABC-type ATPase
MLNPASARRVLILAGPNGAGKTTFAQEFLIGDAECPTFVNADLIAEELSPKQPARAAMRAGRLMVHRIREAAARGESFAFETTLADRNFARSVPQWRVAGYRVTLWFLSLPSPEAAIMRVAERVAQGGHSVPVEVVRRRFRAGWSNFETVYKPVVDGWLLYDNSGAQPVLLDWADNR